MSDERYTVILGDRRYAIHRKWARLPLGQSFGFLYIPAFGADWRALIMQSVDRTRVLNTGVGSRVLASQSSSRWPCPAQARPWRKYWFWLE